MPKVSTQNESRLTFEKAQELFVYDPNVASGLRWRVKPCKNVKVGAMAGTVLRQRSGHIGYQVTVDGVFYYTHRVIWFLHHGSWPASDMVVDHIVGIESGGTNAIENLRLVTYQQNLRGHRVRPTRGYHLTTNGKFQVQLQHPLTGRLAHFGNYPTEADAAEVVAAVQWAFRYLWPECLPVPGVLYSIPEQMMQVL